MAINKKYSFDDNSVKAADFAKALSHPARIEILRILALRDTCICGELVLEMPLAQSTVSQHLKEHKNAGLISGEVDGPRSCYCLNVNGIRELNEIFNGILSEINAKNKKCKC
jgi:DNA-binding transcriptional ArsR family regulator